MAIAFTEKQQQVIDERNCNLLVSAAAGRTDRKNDL